MKKKVYLSGPISGYDLEERKSVFGKAQRAWEAKGYEVFNPMDNGLPTDAGTHEHMRKDIRVLSQCDIIYMMKRWLHSAGCKCEFDVATACGLEVYFEEIGDSVKFS